MKDTSLVPKVTADNFLASLSINFGVLTFSSFLDPI